LGKALQTIDNRDQHVFDAAVLQLVHDAQPEFGALVLLEPQPQNLLGAVGPHAERNVHRLIAHGPLVADLDPQRIEEDQRVGCFQRTRLPGGDFLEQNEGAKFWLRVMNELKMKNGRRRDSVPNNLEWLAYEAATCWGKRTGASPSCLSLDHFARFYPRITFSSALIVCSI